ncbi:hypothetical protein YC2023_117134 [Brassica napus]
MEGSMGTMEEIAHERSREQLVKKQWNGSKIYKRMSCSYELLGLGNVEWRRKTPFWIHEQHRETRAPTQITKKAGQKENNNRKAKATKKQEHICLKHRNHNQ